MLAVRADVRGCCGGRDCAVAGAAERARVGVVEDVRRRLEAKTVERLNRLVCASEQRVHVNKEVHTIYASFLVPFAVGSVRSKMVTIFAELNA